jgi:hypothetical protein
MRPLLKKLALWHRVVQRVLRLSPRVKPLKPQAATSPVAWVELTSTTQRDVLGMWASLLRKMLASNEVADEREDLEDALGTSSGGVPATVNDEASSRAS